MRATISNLAPRTADVQKPLREKSNLLSRFNLIWVVQLSPQIYTSFLSPQISGFFRAVSSRQEGRIAIVTNAGWDAVDARAPARRWSRRASYLVSEVRRAGRTALQRTAKPCGPDTRGWCQAAGGAFDP